MKSLKYVLFILMIFVVCFQFCISLYATCLIKKNAPCRLIQRLQYVHMPEYLSSLSVLLDVHLKVNFHITHNNLLYIFFIGDTKIWIEARTETMQDHWI